MIKTVDKTVVLCISPTLQFCCSPGYYLSTPLFLKLLKQLPFVLIRYVNHHLNYKSKFTKVARNTLHAHFDRPYWSKTLSSILCIFLIIYSVLTNRMSSTFLQTFFGLHNEISISKSIHYYQFSVNFSKRISIPSAVYIHF